MSRKSNKQKNRALGLPTLCPSWCSGGLRGHRRALLEGNDLKDASVHLSEDHGGLVNDIQNYLAKRIDRPGNGGWQVQLTQDDDPDTTHCEMALVRLEIHTSTPNGDGTHAFPSERLLLTTGEARVLAAQLMHLADEEDLHRHRGQP